MSVILLRGRCSWLLLVTMLVLLHLPTSSEAVPASPLVQVRGEVLMVTSELIVVKSPEGTSILFTVGKDTKLDSTLKVGDRVEVVVTEENKAASVKKLSLSASP